MTLKTKSTGTGSMPGADHTVMISGGMQCLNCGDKHMLVLPGLIAEVGAALGFFGARHERCRPIWQRPKPADDMSHEDRISFWLTHGNRGKSSETMFNTFMPKHQIFGTSGFSIARFSPYDIADFQRCSELLTWVPGFRKDLPRMRDVSDTWQRLITYWDQMEGMLATQQYEKLNDLIKMLTRDNLKTTSDMVSKNNDHEN